MCLILFAYHCHRDYPLIVAANRDEFYHRPALAARFWPEQPDLLAGRDLEAGGTWMGVTREGRFAAVTNYRDPQQSPGEHSRGQLCLDFLTTSDTPRQFLAALRPRSANYSGFNLLLWNGDQLMHFCNREMSARALGPGLYGISNGTINDNWPKVTSGRRALAQALARRLNVNYVLDLLGERGQPSDAELPHTGVSLAMERLLAPRFIHSADYGTRASSIVCYHRDGRVRLVERQFAADGTISGQVGFEFTRNAATTPGDGAST